MDPITFAIGVGLGSIAGYLVGRLGKAVLRGDIADRDLMIDDLSARNVEKAAKLLNADEAEAKRQTQREEAARAAGKKSREAGIERRAAKDAKMAAVAGGQGAA